MKADPSQDKYFYITGWIVFGLFALYLLISEILDFSLVRHIPPCALHSMTGYYCPGCGGTRAVLSLIKGNLLTSIFYHPFVIYAFAIGGWFMISQTIERISKHKINIGMHYRHIYLWLALIIIVVNCLIKNLALAIWGIPLMG